MKKMLSVILALVMVFALCTTAFAAGEQTTDGTFDGYQEIVQNSFSQRSATPAALSNSNNKVIIHNKGNLMTSDYFVEGKSDGNSLVAVTYIPVDGKIVETAHFTSGGSMSEAQLSDIVADYENALSFSELPSISTMSTIKHYQWTFPANGKTMASLTTAVTCDRKSSNSTVDGVACSVWDVTTFSQLEKVDAMRLNNQYTRLSVDQPNEHLIAYGPSESTSGGDITVGLDGAGVPSFSYTFNIDGFSVKNLSSMSGEYGRWAFIDNIGNEPEFTTKPGIRATNSKGDFVVELSHTVDATVNAAQSINQSTGVIQIWVNDR